FSRGRSDTASEGGGDDTDARSDPVGETGPMEDDDKRAVARWEVADGESVVLGNRGNGWDHVEEAEEDEIPLAISFKRKLRLPEVGGDVAVALIPGRKVEKFLPECLGEEKL